MNITIIGAGNMGSALASAIYKTPEAETLTIANRTELRLQGLVNRFPEASFTTDMAGSVKEADLVVLAVKPYAMEVVCDLVRPSLKPTAKIFSVAAGVGLDRLSLLVGGSRGGLFYAIPNTAVSIGRGITFIASRDADEPSRTAIAELLKATGQIEFIEERLMPAATALCSCGIAYVFKFIQAATQAGVELGFRPADALSYFTQTVAGAAAMLTTNGKTPTEEIDAVTTPGGMTIKGVNQLDHDGFTSAVINGILKPLR